MNPGPGLCLAMIALLGCASSRPQCVYTSSSQHRIALTAPKNWVYDAPQGLFHPRKNPAVVIRPKVVEVDSAVLFAPHFDDKNLIYLLNIKKPYAVTLKTDTLLTDKNRRADVWVWRHDRTHEYEAVVVFKEKRNVNTLSLITREEALLWQCYEDFKSLARSYAEITD